MRRCILRIDLRVCTGLLVNITRWIINLTFEIGNIKHFTCAWRCKYNNMSVTVPDCGWCLIRNIRGWADNSLHSTLCIYTCIIYQNNLFKFAPIMCCRKWAPFSDPMEHLLTIVWMNLFKWKCWPLFWMSDMCLTQEQINIHWPLNHIAYYSCGNNDLNANNFILFLRMMETSNLFRILGIWVIGLIHSFICVNLKNSKQIVKFILFWSIKNCCKNTLHMYVHNFSVYKKYNTLWYVRVRHSVNIKTVLERKRFNF